MDFKGRFKPIAPQSCGLSGQRRSKSKKKPHPSSTISWISSFSNGRTRVSPPCHAVKNTATSSKGAFSRTASRKWGLWVEIQYWFRASRAIRSPRNLTWWGVEMGLGFLEDQEAPLVGLDSQQVKNQATERLGGHGVGISDGPPLRFFLELDARLPRPQDQAKAVFLENPGDPLPQRLAAEKQMEHVLPVWRTEEIRPLLGKALRPSEPIEAEGNETRVEGNAYFESGVEVVAATEEGMLFDLA
jgi:hypothetical protein